VGQQWDSSDEDEEPKKQGMETIAMAQGSSLPRLFNNLFHDEDHPHFCLMARGEQGTRNYHLIFSILFFIHT
jgi:hypothetical protein